MTPQRSNDWIRDCWFLTGATASGKSAVALEIAEDIGAEIVALDSMTLYRGMDIGTAKPTVEDRARVPHHLIDVQDPSDPASVAWFLDQSKAAVREILARGRRPLFVGGTPLYLKACLRGLFDGPPADVVLRARLEAEAAEIGVPALHARMASVDPASGHRILVNDLRRIVRALEVYEATGRPITDWQQEFAHPADPPPRVACLVRPRDELCRRIEQRIDWMLANGWIEEAAALWRRDPPPGREAAQAVGYGEIADHLAGRIDFKTMRETLVIRTRQFAKRQMTWFRHLEEIRFFPTDEAEPLEELTRRVNEFFAGESTLAEAAAHPAT